MLFSLGRIRIFGSSGRIARFRNIHSTSCKRFTMEVMMEHMLCATWAPHSTPTPRAFYSARTHPKLCRFFQIVFGLRVFTRLVLLQKFDSTREGLTSILIGIGLSHVFMCLSSMLPYEVFSFFI